MSDEHYVYHAPWEPSPRATASGGQNVIETHISQPEYLAHGVHAAEIDRPGYVFHPLGALTDNPIVRGLLPGTVRVVNPVPVRPVGYPVSYPDYFPRLPQQQQPGPNRLPPGSVPTSVCPAWGCDGPPGGGVTPLYVLRGGGIYPYPGATATTPQPPPSAGGSQVVPVTHGLPVSPAPSPTVAVSPDQTAPQLTQPGSTLDSSGASITTAGGIGTWLAQSNLISGIPNWGIAAAGVVALLMAFGGKSGRR